MKENYDIHRYVIHKVESVLKKYFFTFMRSQYLLRNIDASLAFLTDSILLYDVAVVWVPVVMVLVY